MAFNPSPKVAAARDFAEKFNKKIVIIISIDDNRNLEYASYGRNKKLCKMAEKIGDLIFDKTILNWLQIGI